MTDFNWQVVNTERNNDESEGIVILHYRVDCVDGEYTASVYGTVSLTPDPSDANYVAYQDVTHDVAVSWLKDSMDAAEIEAGLTANIESQKTPATLAGMPWAAEEVA
jgi:hypothetical protein